MPSAVTQTQVFDISASSMEWENTKTERANTAFDELIAQIRTVLGDSRDLKSEDIDADQLQSIMRGYVSQSEEWQKYSFIDLTRNYTRNLVDNLNGKANLVLMTWTPGKASLIHDHTNAHCIMRILRGTLRETKYHWPTKGIEGPLQIKAITHFREGEVAYINDDLGLHKVENPSGEEIAVSLHLYTPPYIEQKGCNTFDSKTGKAQHIKCGNYYSRNGSR